MPFVLALAVLTALVPAAARGAEPPAFEADINLDFQSDTTFASDDPALEVTEVSPTIEAELAFRPTREFALVALVDAESVRDPDPFEDAFVEDVGVFFEELYVEYATGTFELVAGKFNPPFGIGWRDLPGLYGSDFADDYELSERLGFGARATFDTDLFGTHTLGASAFFADTSVLSDSALTSRGRLRRSDGGPSNTGDPASFAITLDGTDPAGLSGLSYHAAISRQRPGEGNVGDEWGTALALYGDVPLGDGWSLMPIAEFAAQENDDAGPDDAYYLDGGLEAVNGPWLFTVAGGTRVIDKAGGGTTTDTLFQVSIGYEFEDGPAFELAYKVSEEGGVASHVIGALVAYELEF